MRDAIAQQATTMAGAGVGIEQSASRNPGASPYLYRGIGATWALRLARQADQSEWDVELAGSRATLRSHVSQGGLPREVLTGIGLGGSWLRKTGSTGRVQWLAGAATDADVTYLRHDYSGTFAYSADFGFIAITLAPALKATMPMRSGTLANRTVVPLASWIDYPYSNANAHGDNVRLSFATLNRLQALDDELTYRRGRLTWRYRFSYLRYVLGEPRVFANQSLSLQLDFLHWGKR